MLVLSRRRDQVICIGNEVRITVVDIRGDKTRIGIDAPTSIPVHREEVLQAIEREGGIDRTVCPCCGHKRQEVISDEV